jgi:hypothetical protein
MVKHKPPQAVQLPVRCRSATGTVLRHAGPQAARTHLPPSHVGSTSLHIDILRSIDVHAKGTLTGCSFWVCNFTQLSLPGAATATNSRPTCAWLVGGGEPSQLHHRQWRRVSASAASSAASAAASCSATREALAL